MNKLSFSLFFVLFLTAFSTYSTAQNQIFGIINTANTYSKVDSFDGDFAHVGTSKRDGVIDKEGREIIPCHQIALSIPTLSLFKEGRLPVKNRDGLYGYYDSEGNVVIPFIYKSAQTFNGGIAAVEREDGKWGVIDKNGNTVIPFGYEIFGGFSDGLAYAGKKIENKKKASTYTRRAGYVDIRGNEVIPLIYKDVSSFSEGLARVEDANGNYSFFDKKGQKIFDLDEKYSWVCSSFSEGYAAVKDRETKKYGFIDKTGKLVIPCVYDNLDIDFFKNGVAIVSKDKLYGLIDKSGKVIAPISYEYIDHNWSKRKWTEAKKDGKCGVLDVSGKEVIPCSYQSLESWGDGLIAVYRDGKWGFIDENGKQIAPYEYDKTSPFRSGFAEVKKDGKEGLIDMSGRLVIPCAYELISYSSLYNLVLFKENGRYGFFDCNGTMVIPPVFSECTHFNQDGLALTSQYVLSLKNRPAQYMSYIEASEKGFADAQFFRALDCFQKGNKEEGRKWLDKAVQQGLAVAQHLMGTVYRKGYGVEKNTNLATFFEMMAAKKGNIPAMAEVGLAFAAKDLFDEALEWFRKGVEAGSSDAYLYLGICYEEGLGVDVNLEEAYRLISWSYDRNFNKTAGEARKRIREKMKQ